MALNSIWDKYKKSDIGARMINGAFWSFSGTALAKIIVLVSSIACAHILGKDEYGEFGMVRSTINMFVVFGMAGLGLTAAKYVSEFRSTNPERIGRVIVLTNGFAFLTGIIVTTIVFCFSRYLAEKTLDTPHLVNPIRVGALLLFVSIVNGAMNGSLSGFEKFKSIAINTLIGSLAEGVLMLVGAYYYGVFGAILGFGCGIIVLYVSNYISINRKLNQLNIHCSLSDIKKEDLSLLYKFSIPAALSSFMVTPVYWCIRSMLVRSSGYAELAVYEASDQWKLIILFIPSAISQIVLPILSGVASTDENKFWKVLKLNIYLNGGIASIICIFVIFAGPYIMGLYGKEYDDYLPLILLALSTIPSSLATVVGLSISSRAKMWVGFLFNIVWGGMVLFFSYLFTNDGMGASGLALAILLAYSFHTVFQFSYLKFNGIISKSN